VRAEAAGVGDGGVPDGAHGPALDEEEEDLDGVGEGGEEEEGVQKVGCVEAGAVDEAEDGEVDEILTRPMPRMLNIWQMMLQCRACGMRVGGRQ